MKNSYTYRISALIFSLVIFSSCGTDFLDLKPRGTVLETNFYKTQDEMFVALVAAYDVLSWNGTNGWTMKVGLLNAASDDCYAGGSDDSDQPSWVAYDNFTLDPFLGPQAGFWNKGYSGIYRTNLFLEKLPLAENIEPDFAARTTAEAKFLRAYYYFDLVRFFNRVPLITKVLSADEIYSQVQATPEAVYAQIEKDLKDARATFELPETVPPDEFGRITKGAVTALLGKVILFQNDESRMGEAAALFQELIDSGLYDLEPNFEDIFKNDHEFGIESVFEIQHSGASNGGWESFINGTEGNYDVQFFGMRDYVGPLYATRWSFCPVKESLAADMANDPRFGHTIIDGNALKTLGAFYTEGFQNTDYFVKKYSGLEEDRPTDGEPALNWGNNVRDIRYADVLLMAAEAMGRAGQDAAIATGYINQVRGRVGLQGFPPLSGENLLNAISLERRMELATEGHRFFDLVRTGKAEEVLGSQGFTSGKNEVLPIPQTEIDITEGVIMQNPGY